AGPVRQVAASPDGGRVAYVTADGMLFLWSSGRAPVRLLTQVVGTPAWSPDSTRLAVQADGGVLSFALSQDASGPAVRLASGTDASAIEWSPDGNAVAISSTGGVVLVSADGTLSRLVDAHPAGSAIVWTIAG